MQKKSLKICGLTAIMGVFGAFIRWVQSLSAFEEGTGLAIPNAPWSYVLFIFMLATLTVIIFMVRSFKKDRFSADFATAMAYENRFIDISAIFIGVIMAVGGAAELFSSLKTDPMNIFGIITGAFAIICAACIASFLRSPRRDHPDTRGRSMSVIVVLFLCYWLISTYKMFSSDPVIWHFAPRLLAISAAILAYYFVAGFPFNKPRPMLSVFFCLLGAFLLIITLADSLMIGEQLIAFSIAAMLLLVSFVILSNAGKSVEYKQAED